LLWPIAVLLEKYDLVMTAINQRAFLRYPLPHADPLSYCLWTFHRLNAGRLVGLHEPDQFGRIEANHFACDAVFEIKKQSSPLVCSGTHRDQKTDTLSDGGPSQKRFL
jgi:hypothetical protein